MQTEEWRDIEGYEGLYQVSNLGNVRSFKKDPNGKLLKPGKNNCCYYSVSLWKNGKQKIFLVHRLVGQAFLPNHDSLPCINHRDKDPSNNQADNLEWCTYSYNINYGTGNQMRAEKLSKKVFQFTLSGELVAEYMSVSEAARQIGCDNSGISACCLGKQKTYKGYKWSYS